MPCQPLAHCSQLSRTSSSFCAFCICSKSRYNWFLSKLSTFLSSPTRKHTAALGRGLATSTRISQFSSEICLASIRCDSPLALATNCWAFCAQTEAHFSALSGGKLRSWSVLSSARGFTTLRMQDSRIHVMEEIQVLKSLGDSFKLSPRCFSVLGVDSHFIRATTRLISRSKSLQLSALRIARLSCTLLMSLLDNIPPETCQSVSPSNCTSPARSQILDWI